MGPIGLKTSVYRPAPDDDPRAPRHIAAEPGFDFSTVAMLDGAPDSDPLDKPYGPEGR